jgi:hypothetical protein
MKLPKTALAIGSAIGARQLARSIQGLEMNDVLAPVGLERRRSTLDRVLPAAAWLGLGTILGAGVALLLAPRSGKETRARVTEQLDEAKERVGREIRSMEGAAREAVHSNGG